MYERGILFINNASNSFYATTVELDDDIQARQAGIQLLRVLKFLAPRTNVGIRAAVPCRVEEVSVKGDIKCLKTSQKSVGC